MKISHLVYGLAAALLLAGCGKANVPVYCWGGFPEGATEESLQSEYKELKARGVNGVCINGGFDLDKVAVAARAAHSQGLEYHAWAPCMLQGGLDPGWYAVNRLGQSAYDVQAYVPYYKALDPRNPEVIDWLVDKYTRIAEIPEVDYVQLDYIRYPDVILSRGLWDKYGLVMDEEYPVADYCYCPRCTAAFLEQTGIDILKVEDPSKVKEWAQFRCDAITELVCKIVDAVHAKGKKVSADVFPGPASHAEWMVRQQWDRWPIDMVFPMNYNDFYLEPAEWLGEITAEEVKSTSAPVMSGLFICHDWQRKASIEDPEGHGLIPSEMETAVRGALDAGAAGICLFTYGSMTPEHWEALEKALQR